MKVLLIKPGATVWGEDQVLAPPTPRPPVGLGYIAAYLRQNGYPEVGVLDASKGEPIKIGNGRWFFGRPLERIVEEITSGRPDVIGISCLYTSYYMDTVVLAEAIKKVLPLVPIVIGGSHATTFHREMALHPAIDVVVKGEGEKVFLDIVECLEKSRPLEKVPNTTQRRGGEIIDNGYEVLEKDLDKYPMPAYDLLDIPYYKTVMGKYYCREYPVLGVVTSRGCPNDCVYCSVALLYGRGWRHHSAGRICDEIELLQKNYGIREIAFQDDSISANPKHLEAICDEILRRKMDFSWATPNGIAHWTLTKPLVKKMKQAGCYRLTFGLESGNPEIRKFIGKGHASLDQAGEIIRYANSIGLWTIGTFILGFPQETKEQMMDTLRAAVASDVDFAVFYQLIYFPRTRVYEMARKMGLVDFEKLLDPRDPESWMVLKRLTSQAVQDIFNGNEKASERYTKKEIADMVSFAHRYFFKKRIYSFFNPLRLAVKLAGWKEFKYGLALAIKGIILGWRMAANRGRFTFNSLYKNTKNVLGEKG